MRILTPAFLAPAALLLACAPAALFAQAVVQALPGTTDADRLAEQMRALASNPRDLNALIVAADLSLSLGDLSGAASLYARAEKVSATDPRIRAGEGAILVRSERPGEALRYFAQAEAGGADVRSFVADRALAYDLIGQQERAQRDYRLALKTRPDDEIVRRYALSLGISGKRDAALEQIDPLLRKTDRSAWRIRAFILAMGGDQAGAEKIATTMLPAGMAQGLLPFFRRLPTLPAADRAFAVHFGEVHTTPERLADARLAPILPQLAPEPAPVALAAVQPATQTTKSEKRRRGGRRNDTAVALAANVAKPAQIVPPPAPPIPAANAYAAQTTARVQLLPDVTPTTSTNPNPSYTAANALTTVRPGTLPASQLGYAAPVTLASAATSAPPRASSPTTGVSKAPTVSNNAATAPVIAARAPVTAMPQPTPAASVSPTSAANTLATASTPLQPYSAKPSTVVVTPAPVAASLPTTAPTQVATIRPVTPVPQPSTPNPMATASAISSSAASTLVASAAPGAVPVSTPSVPALGYDPTVAKVATAAAPPESSYNAPPSRAEADSVLARIVAGLSIPASELGVTEPVRVAAVPTAASPDTAARVLAEAKAKEARDALAEKALAAKTLADKRTADRKALADKKALAAKKLADAEKLEAAKQEAEDRKAAAEAKKAARANPARIWVQVAGGANEGDLPKAYAAVKAKAPDIFGGRGAWSTPLRATNRVLVGPFKTDADARSFVNQLKKGGVSAFTFTSDAGQSVTKLPAK